MSPRDTEGSLAASANEDENTVIPEETVDDQPVLADQMEQKRRSSLKTSIEKFGRQLEKVIDDSPIGFKLKERPRRRKNSAYPDSRSGWNPDVASSGDKERDHLARLSRGQSLVHPTPQKKLEDIDTNISPSSPNLGITKAIKKGAVAMGGGALIGVGVVMIPTLPPPFASLTILGGYAVLGTAFEGPRKVVKDAREQLTTSLNEENIDIDKLPDDWEEVGKHKEKKDNRFKKAAKSFGKSIILPALNKVCTVYEKLDEEEKNPNDHMTSGKITDDTENKDGKNIEQDKVTEDDPTDGGDNNHNFDEDIVIISHLDQ
eukprot:CAMPEP_0198287392 /NCGR_PEP_ID=MMETSP1449-20131203/6229_1 /TAXON_ID=420275 /ORGANISM="Attheya septentrionalis, Strain CCMP2084" /LENGTH=316 /DNA_ID=CAMNT_0043985343 /DNA_START=29 /DNA_END=979 /DNA_ORIENTATION=+